MRGDGRQADRQAGMTITEVVVASALIAAILGMVYSGVLSVHSAAQRGDAALRQQASRRTVLEAIRGELEMTSLDDARCTIAADGRSVQFARLIGAQQTGNEVSGLWSSTIELAIDANGNVVRRQDGGTALLATGIKDLRFQRPSGQDFIEITVTTVRTDSHTGAGVDDVRTIRVIPRN
jgi:hypothetical protein